MIALVDTCVWSLALRRTAKHLNADETRILGLLKEMILEGRTRMLGVVRQELLTGVRHNTQFGVLLKTTRGFEDVPLEVGDYEAAAAAANSCQSVGIAGSTVDFLICAVAVRRNWAILTTDGDFARYQRRLEFKLIS